MIMKNFFSVNKTQNREAVDFDRNPYLAAEASEAVRERQKAALAELVNDSDEVELSDADKALQKKARLLGGLGLLALGLAILLFLLSSENPSKLITGVELAILAVSVVLTFISRRMNQRLTNARVEGAKVDLEAASAALEAAARDAARELGIPDATADVDILPFHYRVSGSGEHRSVARRSRYDNLTVALWREGDTLCLGTAQELYRIPVADLRGYRYVDENFEIDYWLKDEEPDTEAYKAFDIRKAGMFAWKCRGMYALSVADELEILIPAYDWEKAKAVIPEAQEK